MNVDEAIAKLDELIIYYGMTDMREAFNILTSNIERKVDDAMVERYAASYFNWWDKIPEPSRVIYRKEIRDALIAALGVEG